MPTLAFILALSALASSQEEPTKFVVHEWGTFTSVVTAEGHEIEWNSLVLDDLPEFIYQTGFAAKAMIKGRIRMETPVLYFYSQVPREVSVSVDFPDGHLTEWYPRAKSKEDSLKWTRFQLDPELALSPAVEVGGDHYYAARGVASTPLAITNNDELIEPEKFLFYRGVGQFESPLAARLEGREVLVRNRTDEVMSSLMLFERTEEGIAYFIERDLTPEEGERSLDRDRLTFLSRGRLDDLKRILRESGLFEDEAQAMIDTWRHDWFEPGLRVFYTVPDRSVERVLPIKVEPEPDELLRVLIGRVELIEDPRAENIRLFLKTRKENPKIFEELVERFGRFSLAVAQDGFERTDPNPEWAKRLARWRMKMSRQ